MKNRLSGTLLFLSLWLGVVSCGKGSFGEKEGAVSRLSVVETGELAAINTRSFVAQRFLYWNEMRIIGILEHGAIVQEGDSIIQLDPTEINKYILDRETDLETQQANLEKLMVQQANTNLEMESSLKSQRASFELKKLRLESIRFESPRQQQIKELEFEQAKITMAKEERKIELNKIIQATDLMAQKVRIQQLEREIKNAYDILPQLTIRTPVAGVFQIAWHWRSNGLLKVGDNVYSGNNMASVPVLKQMRVNTYINETDFLKIYPGQQVSVRLDAMPELVFEGEVSYIGKLCRRKENNSKQKIFDVEVVIKGSDERLKPGMTVSCEFLDCKSI